MILGNFMLLNLFLAILLKSISEIGDGEDEENPEAKAGEEEPPKHQIHQGQGGEVDHGEEKGDQGIHLLVQETPQWKEAYQIQEREKGKEE